MIIDFLKYENCFNMNYVCILNFYCNERIIIDDDTDLKNTGSILLLFI